MTRVQYLSGPQHVSNTLMNHNWLRKAFPFTDHALFLSVATVGWSSQTVLCSARFTGITMVFRVELIEGLAGTQDRLCGRHVDQIKTKM